MSRRPSSDVVRRAHPVRRHAGRAVAVTALAAVGVHACQGGGSGQGGPSVDDLAKALRSEPIGFEQPDPTGEGWLASVPDAFRYPALQPDGNAFNASRRRFARDVLNGIDAPVTAPNLVAIMAWAVAESGGTQNAARNNPLNTAWIGGDRKDVPGAVPFNSVGVMHLPSYQAGVYATVLRLHKGETAHYRGIVAALRSGRSAMAVAQAIAASPWGTRDGVVQVLQDRHGWAQFHPQPVVTRDAGNTAQVASR